MPLKLSEPWWLDKSQYTDDTTLPAQLERFAGPKGLALVKHWPSGQTSSGWGLKGKDGAAGFMENYTADQFNARRIMHGYERDRYALALVMRSVRLVVIDIDGKNGGFDHAEELIAGAPPTLAELSKSGNGMHLFYYLDEDWDDETGFGSIGDSIGIVEGVDVRGIGCVFHHKQQRWNSRAIAKMPRGLAERLLTKQKKKAADAAAMQNAIENADEEELLMMHEHLIEELNRPVKQGSRNTAMYAIGAKMFTAGVPEWDKLLLKRCDEIGLEVEESEKLVENIPKYEA